VSTITMRPGRPDDAPAVAALLVALHDVHVAAVPDAFRPTTLANEERRYREQHLGAPESRAFVAEADGEVVGYLWIRLAMADPLDSSWPRRYADIDSLVVAKTRQGTGIGRQLLDVAHGWAKTQGVTETRLVVYAGNPAALAFYERLGYTTRARTLHRAIDAEASATPG
jgi:ribosomal protein S18 acetylase RimI-like enzyme